jgi:hypothetical protein
MKTVKEKYYEYKESVDKGYGGLIHEITDYVNELEQQETALKSIFEELISECILMPYEHLYYINRIKSVLSNDSASTQKVKVECDGAKECPRYICPVHTDMRCCKYCNEKEQCINSCWFQEDGCTLIKHAEEGKD